MRYMIQFFRGKLVQRGRDSTAHGLRIHWSLTILISCKPKADLFNSTTNQEQDCLILFGLLINVTPDAVSFWKVTLKGSWSSLLTRLLWKILNSVATSKYMPRCITIQLHLPLLIKLLLKEKQLLSVNLNWLTKTSIMSAVMLSPFYLLPSFPHHGFTEFHCSLQS